MRFGVKSCPLARQAIIAGDADIIVAGGMENMSQAPYLLKNGREGFKMGDQKIIDSMITDGLWCAFNDYHMGITAENLCDRYAITREEQDAFSAKSQQKAAAAIEAGRLRKKLFQLKFHNVKASRLFLIRMNMSKQEQQLKNLGNCVRHLKRMVV